VKNTDKRAIQGDNNSQVTNYHERIKVGNATVSVVKYGTLFLP